MITESQLYDLGGLFHSVVKQSAVMQGRYAVLEHGDRDLDRGNLLTGVELPQDKYPLVACFAPTSQIDIIKQREVFSFRVLFLTTVTQDGTGAQAMRDHRTNTSGYRSSLAWADMKTEATLFIKLLELMQTTPALRNHFYLVDHRSFTISRFSSKQRDDVSGVVLRFECGIAYPCEIEDLDGSGIIMPSTSETVKEYIDRVLAGSGAAPGFVANEKPLGVQDGENNIFTTEFAFVPSTVVVSLDGLEYKPGKDYTLTGDNVIVFTHAPLPESEILVDYFKKTV